MAKWTCKEVFKYGYRNQENINNKGSRGKNHRIIIYTETKSNALKLIQIRGSNHVQSRWHF